MRDAQGTAARSVRPPAVAELIASPLFADHPDALVVCWAETAVVVALNASASQMFAVQTEAVAGLPLSEWLPPEVVQELIARHPGMPQRRMVVEAVPYPQGNRTVEFAARHMDTSDGGVVLLSLHDVTAHREAERALQLSHQRFEHVSQATSDAVWDLDVGTGQIWWNERYFAIFGIDAASEAASLEGWRARVHPDDVQRVSESLDAALANGERSWQARYRFRRGDGSWASVLDRGVVLRAPDGKPVRMVGGVSDETERFEAEARVRESEERFREMVYHLQDVLWVLEVGPPRLSYVSPGIAAIAGVTAEQLMKDASIVRDLVHPEDRAAVRQTLQRPDTHFMLEYRIVRDGEVRWIRSEATPVRDAQGRVRRVAGVSRDITEQKRLTEQLFRTQRLESIGTLAGGIAHDLNNILAPISMSAQLLAERLQRAQRPADPDELMEWVLVIEDAARRGTNLVKQVLRFARGEEGERKPLEPRQLLRDLARIVRETFPKDITLRVLTPADGWLLDGDATQLQQVLLNLAVNARDAMPGGGKLTLSARNATLHDAMAQQLSLQLPPGRYVRLAVEDTGCGIPPAQQARIFDPFFTTKPVGKGTGLGLSTAMTIVRQHSGQLRVESLEQVGTTFELWLPASSHSPAAVVPQTTGPSGHNEGIVVVDDEGPIREVLHALLTRAGYRVWTARHGAEALDLIERLGDAVQLVLTDLTMPVMDGAALAIALADQRPALPVIATSGLVGDFPDGPQIPRGVRAFFPKPFDAHVLLQTLADILRPV